MSDCDAPTSVNDRSAYAHLEHSMVSPGQAFRLHYTLTGSDAIDPADADGDGTPDAVQAHAADFDDALELFVDALGYRPPPSDIEAEPNGGDGRLDIYLAHNQDSATILGLTSKVGGGFCEPGPSLIQLRGTIREHSPAVRAQTRNTAAHELFHAIQLGYHRSGSIGKPASEGTATWAGYQLQPEFDWPGAMDSYRKGLDARAPGFDTWIWWLYLSEKFGPEVVRSFWENTGARSTTISVDWIDVLEEVLGDHDTTVANELVEFARWNLYTNRYANAELAYDDGHLLDAPRMTNLYGDAAARPVACQMGITYYVLSVEGEGEIAAAVRPEQDRDDSHLSLVVATRSESEVVDVRRIDDVTDAAPQLATDGVRELVVGIVNASRDDILQPLICLGSAQDVASCK